MLTPLEAGGFAAMAVARRGSAVDYGPGAGPAIWWFYSVLKVQCLMMSISGLMTCVSNW